MQLNIRAKHLKLTPAISDYVHKKVEKAQKYSDSIIWAQAVLSVEKHRQIAEIIVHTPGNTFRTLGESTDLYAAIDNAVHKLDLHLSRVNDKQKNHRKENILKNASPQEVAEILTMKKNHSVQNEKESIRKISEFTTVALKSLSLSQAMEECDHQGLPVLPFIDEKTNSIHILYKKGKSGYHLIQTEES